MQTGSGQLANSRPTTCGTIKEKPKKINYWSKKKKNKKITVKIEFTLSLYSAVQMQLPETSRLQSSVHQSLEFPEIHCPGADAGTAEILRPGHAPSVPSE